MPSLPARLRSALRFVLALFVLLQLAGCGDEPLVRQESYVFGTRVEVVSQGAPKARADAALAEVLREFDRLHRTYHAWQPSALTALNEAFAKGGDAPANAEMRFLIARAQDYAARSDNLFEPAIGHLIELWGFHSDSFEPRLPPAAQIQALVAARPHVSEIVVRGERASSRNPAVALDFGGLVKGYALDRAARILRAHGIHNALINIGGNVMALGSKGDHPWTVGIQHPRQTGAIATLALYDGEAIGTSGDYQRYFELGGQRYSHLLDPRSGVPARETEAVTVLVTPRSDAGLISDVASKPVFLAGDDWRDMARRCDVDAVLRVDAAGRISVTRAMRARLRWEPGMAPDSVLE